mmetsp:Transcript_11675/g.24883  ORF Transcript_11675/g.24883 Transcript_11675/m.24883 type:complete len:217 (+) Transcript_11675:128-778(+)
MFCFLPTEAAAAFPLTSFFPVLRPDVNLSSFARVSSSLDDLFRFAVKGLAPDAFLKSGFLSLAFGSFGGSAASAANSPSAFPAGPAMSAPICLILSTILCSKLRVSAFSSFSTFSIFSLPPSLAPAAADGPTPFPASLCSAPSPSPTLASFAGGFVVFADFFCLRWNPPGPPPKPKSSPSSSKPPSSSPKDKRFLFLTRPLLLSFALALEEEAPCC